MAMRFYDADAGNRCVVIDAWCLKPAAPPWHGRLARATGNRQMHAGKVPAPQMKLAVFEVFVVPGIFAFSTCRRVYR